ncbi:hypothetical protein BVY02_00450 [bacterium J17]|nr:hypothetical protein BVY02_00450 [bacterium J17]
MIIASNQHLRQQSKELIIQENGSLMIFVGIMATAIVLFVGLAIDVSRISTSHTQIQSTSEYIALGALEAYLANKEAGGTASASMAAAKSRAEEIGGFSFILGQPNTAPVTSGELHYNSNGNAGKLRVGTWEFVPAPSCLDADASTSCPCGLATPEVTGTPSSPDDWLGPCFVQVDPLAGEEVNAFEVELYTRASSPIQSMFRAVMGGKVTPENITLQGRATASRVPRMGVFAVDLSPSTRADTHVQSGIYLRQYAYKLLGPTSAEAECSHNGGPKTCACPDSGLSNPCMLTDQCLFAGFDGIQWNGILNEGPPDNRCRSDADFEIPNMGYDYVAPAECVGAGPATPVVSPAVQHVRSDYLCYIVPYTENGVALEDHYLIDTRWWNPLPADPNDYYDGPEPLTTILLGINSALTAFESRAVPGDRAGIVGFDQSALLEERVFDVVETTTPEFQDLKELTDIDLTGKTYAEIMDLRERRIERVLFPRQGSTTDLRAGLIKALSMITDEELFGIGQSFAVVFSDGLSNCTVASGDCQNDWNYINDAYNEIVAGGDSITNEYRQRRIPIHFVLIGESVAPHTLLIKNQGGDGCVTDYEVRTGAFPTLTNGWHITNGSDYAAGWQDDQENAFNNMSPSTPFYQSGWVYEIPRLTGGIWAPLRNCCTDGTGACADVQSTLETACAGGPSGDSTLPVLPNSSKFMPNTVVINSGGTLGTPGNYTDSAGRLICDPRGYSRRTQMIEYMNEIMSVNPFVLVQ